MTRKLQLKAIPWDQLCICYHSHAAFANAQGHKTQAGYVVAFAEKKIEQNETSMWSPCAWKSYKPPRVVASTLGAESQAYSTACAVAEWMALLLAETQTGRFDLRSLAHVSDTPMSVQVGAKMLDHVRRVPIEPFCAKSKSCAATITLDTLQKITCCM